MTATAAKIEPGDMYCPHCLVDTELEMTIEHAGATFTCGNCRRHFQHPYTAGTDGRFTWVWDNEHPRPNPGCPWCGTCNIGASTWYTTPAWRCYRLSCGKHWQGSWHRYDNDWTRDRWTIRIPVTEVPWASGTPADLECLRLGAHPSGYRFEPNPSCCRYPKSCSAFAPGFTTGKGPTTLPHVWNDGYQWRTGAPDITDYPPHLLEDVIRRWIDATGTPQFDTDEHDAYNDTHWNEP